MKDEETMERYKESDLLNSIGDLVLFMSAIILSYFKFSQKLDWISFMVSLLVILIFYFLIKKKFKK